MHEWRGSQGLRRPTQGIRPLPNRRLLMRPEPENANEAEPLRTIPKRVPRLARPTRIEPLATLPVFFKLEGKRVVVAGGSEAAAWKAELLSAAGALVVVYAPDCCPELEALAA